MKKQSLKQKIFSFSGRGYVIVSKHADPTVKQRAQESSKAAAETLTQSWNYISAHELDYRININDFVLLGALTLLLLLFSVLITDILNID